MHVVPNFSNSDKLQLQPVLAIAVKKDPGTPLKSLVDKVEVHWPPGTEDKADRLFHQLYECAFHPGVAHPPWSISCKASLAARVAVVTALCSTRGYEEQ